MLGAEPTIDMFVLPPDGAAPSATMLARHIATAAVKLTFTRIASLSLFLLRAFAIQDGALTKIIHVQLKIKSPIYLNIRDYF